ncbi:hypothetical protein ACFSC6_20630 [Rufibacter sediminis]|uniref:Glycosyl hydrolases family 2 sugar binding domain-containing protein n=1 Tax=Rufibacter sediminis TaxID=2762756 RepID=A0ABR6VPI0_9BACT|nr:hypothetical protein [Rufibacter sediminis]MBC3539102.1 hypothetical protein [Rufibacter sediminis]
MDMPSFEGMVWLRKTISVPVNMTGKELSIHLGHPEMNYSLYFNGKEISRNVWNASPTHHYRIPVRIVKRGQNALTLRMASWGWRRLQSSGRRNVPDGRHHTHQPGRRLEIPERAGTFHPQDPQQSPPSLVLLSPVELASFYESTAKTYFQEAECRC